MRTPERDDIYAVGEHTKVLLWVSTLGRPATEPTETTDVRGLLPSTELSVVLLLCRSELISTSHLDHRDGSLQPLLAVVGELLFVRPLATGDSREGSESYQRIF